VRYPPYTEGVGGVEGWERDPSYFINLKIKLSLKTREEEGERRMEIAGPKDKVNAISRGKRDEQNRERDVSFSHRSRLREKVKRGEQGEPA